MRVVGFAFLLALVSACGKDPDESAVRAARWEIDESENLAVPVCAECGEVLDRDRSACTKCGTLFNSMATAKPGQSCRCLTTPR